MIQADGDPIPGNSQRCDARHKFPRVSFSSLAVRLEHKPRKPSVEVVFVFAGSNDLDNVATI